jgi:hypothetical protein
MRRRLLLKAVATLPAAVPFLKAQDNGAQKPKPSSPDEIHHVDTANIDLAGTADAPRFFSEAQFAALERLCDVIAPALPPMPGALAAGVPAFLDFLIGQSPADRQKLYRDGLDLLSRSGFPKAAASEIDAALAPLRSAWKPSGGEGQERFLRAAKEDILQATANSREWIAAASKRNRNARGLGTYWRGVE